MFALIFWLKDHNTSIVAVEDLHPNVEEGQTTSVRYSQDNKMYKGKVVKKSCKYYSVLSYYK